MIHVGIDIGKSALTGARSLPRTPVRLPYTLRPESLSNRLIPGASHDGSEMLEPQRHRGRREELNTTFSLRSLRLSGDPLPQK